VNKQMLAAFVLWASLSWQTLSQVGVGGCWSYCDHQEKKERRPSFRLVSAGGSWNLPQ
jgi:hypothetical protein